MSQADSPSQRTGPSYTKDTTNVKISTVVPNKSSTMNMVRMMAATSKMAINKTTSNFFMDTMDKIQQRTTAIKVDSKTTCYERLKVTSSPHYFRDDWGGVTAIRYLPDGERIAVGFNSGDLQVCPPLSGGTMRNNSFETIIKGWEGNDGISCIQCHPKKPSFLYASSTAGTVMRRDLEDAANYNDYCVEEQDNEIYSICFSGNGELVTAGRDATLRVYDVEEERMISELGRRGSESLMSNGGSSETFPGEDPSFDTLYHEKRVYCVRSVPDDPPLLVSGGWDGVRVWDTRVSEVVRSIVGPFIYGDAVDVCKGTVLTASCEAHDTLQLWDLGSGFLIDSIDPPNKRVYLYGEYPYTAQFFRGDPTGDLVLCGVGGLQLISIKESSVLYIFEDEKPVVAVDSTDKRFAFGGKSGIVLHGKVVFPENDTVPSSTSFTSRTISSKSEEFSSSVSDSKKEVENQSQSSTSKKDGSVKRTLSTSSKKEELYGRTQSNVSKKEGLENQIQSNASKKEGLEDPAHSSISKKEGVNQTQSHISKKGEIEKRTQSKSAS